MAGKYDASTDEIDVGTWNVGAIQTFHIGFWVFVDSFVITDARFISKASGTASDNHDWMVGEVFATTQRWRTRFKTTGIATTQVGSSTMNTGQWYFALFQYDGTDSKLFVDDVADIDVVKTGNMNVSAREIFIGNNAGDAKAPNANLAEMFVLSSLLNAGARTGLSHGVNILGVVPISEAYWPLWLNNTTTTPEFSSNARTGTITTVTKSNHPPVELMENYL